MSLTDLFIATAHAQEAAASSPPAAALLMSYLPILLIFVVFYFLVIRPQNTAARDHAKMVAELKKGDTVLTDSGLAGTVASVGIGFAKVTVSMLDKEPVVLTIALGSIKRLLTEGEAKVLAQSSLKK